jgi:hypothetical protein
LWDSIRQSGATRPVRRPFGRWPATRPIEFNGIKNNILDILCRQDRLPEGLGDKLVLMAGNPAHDEVWREYSIQYFGACYEHAAAQSAADRMAGKRILDGYRQAITERSGTLAGTALLGLEYLSRTHPEIDQKEIAGLASALAADEKCSEASRITAIRLCGTLRQTESRGLARALAQTGSSAMLRMAAIATLGEIGEPEDVPLLESLSRDDDKRIADVSSHASKRLSQEGLTRQP